MKTRICLLASIWLALWPALASGQPPAATITGTVSALDGDGQSYRLPGVTMELIGARTRSLRSDDVGEYIFGDLPPGTYTLTAELPGFEPGASNVTLDAGSAVVIDIRLTLSGIYSEVTVAGDDSRTLQPRSTAPPTEIGTRTLRHMPIATEQFQSALPLVPGVVRGPDGTLNVKGARENQSGLTVNNASVTDPVTGRFAFRLPIEAVRSLQVVTNPYAPEYGQVSGGITKIETATGTEEWKIEVQDIEPRLRRRDGRIHGIESWTPRVAVGGPVARRLTVFESIEYQFTKSLVEGLPPDEGDTRLEGFSAFAQGDWSPGPNDRVRVAAAVFPQQLGFVGLNTFNARQVTPDIHQRGSLWTVTERRVVTPTSFVESHVSVNLLQTDVYPSAAGPAMIIAPEENAGSYFSTRRRNSRRYQGLVEYTIAPAAGGGAHLIKLGAGAGHDSFHGTTENRPVLLTGRDSAPRERIAFEEAVALAGNKTDLWAFAQDAWSVAERLTLDFGVRVDRDTVAQSAHAAPRLALSLAAPGGRTLVRGGAGLFLERLTLDAATFGQQPWRTATRFAAVDPDATSSAAIERPLVDGSLQNPESVAWNVEVDRELTSRLVVRAAYQRRDSRRQLIVQPRAGGALILGNSGRAQYRELELTGRYRAGGDQVVVSYVRSAATGDLNTLDAVAGDLQDPVVRPNEWSRLPFDAPNRVLAWGEFELLHGLGVAPLVEIRDGFPLSVFDERHDFVGGRNRAGRFPRFFSLDLQAWRHVTLPWPPQLHARIGLKVFNITDHFNPRDFQGNLASVRFGEFSNGVSRTFRGKFVIDF